MRKLCSLLVLSFVMLGIFFNTAEAARFGGGRSFGTQRSISSFQRAAQPLRAAAPNAAPNRWLGPLAGFAAGGLLASLFMGHGMGGGLLSWLVILGVGFMLLNLFRGRMQAAAQSAQYNRTQQSSVVDMQPQFSCPVQNRGESPAGFIPDEFLRNAKVQFIRLQAAYDKKDLNDLREFTAPEVFGEIQLQLQERGEEINQTEVVSLNAELLDVTSETYATITSVQFSGMIKEAVNTPAAPFKETWHFRKDNGKENWMVIGVQQDLH